ncbi:zinc ribbon domain-containing protein [bacterium]|nr:zinc ribbon domain-containing protein [bacterium]
MARYVYFCSKCSKQYEVDKPMAEAARLETCPTCHVTGERVFTAPGVSIKGAPVRFKDGNEINSGNCGGGCCGDGSCSVS